MAACAAMVGIGLHVLHARPSTGPSVRTQSAACATMIRVRLDILDAIAATARPVASVRTTDPGTAVAARPTVVPIRRQVVDARSGTAPLRSGTDGVTRPAVITIRLQINALPAAAGLPLGTRGGAIPAVPLVGVQIEALAVTRFTAALALAFATAAFRPGTAIVVLVARPPHLLAGGGRVAPAAGQEQAEPRAEQGLAGGAAGGGQCSRQRVKARAIHGRCPFRPDVAVEAERPRGVASPASSAEGGAGTLSIDRCVTRSSRGATWIRAHDYLLWRPGPRSRLPTERRVASLAS